MSEIVKLHGMELVRSHWEPERCVQIYKQIPGADIEPGWYFVEMEPDHRFNCDFERCIPMERSSWRLYEPGSPWHGPYANKRECVSAAKAFLRPSAIERREAREQRHQYA